MRRILPTVVVLAVLLLGGCLSAPTSTVESGGDEIQVRDGSLPVDPDTVYRRMSELLGTDAEPPSAIQVGLPGNRSEGLPASRGLPPFWAAMGLDRGVGEVDLSSLENGFTDRSGRITILPGDNDTDAIHYVLAHEYVHYVQVREGRTTQLSTQVDGLTTDGSFVIRAMLEGVAVYVTDEYIERYVPTNATNSGLYLDLRSKIPAGSAFRYSNARYVFGHRYVAARVDSPAAASAVYERPPTTSEQVIHRLPPGSEPPSELTVRVETGGWERVGTDRMGEGFLRVALQNGLPPSVAARAAAGWGNDSLRVFRANSTKAFAWVVRFDDRTNATEFETAIERSLDARGNRSGEVWTVDDRTFDAVRVGPNTTLVLVGPEPFVRKTEASRDGGVVLTLPAPTGNATETGTGDGRMAGNLPRERPRLGGRHQPLVGGA